MDQLKKYLIDNSISDIDELLEKFELYYNLLIEWNNKFNLTAITDKTEVEIKHFIDSLTGYKLLNQNDYICDVGAGAGFPSIPLALLMPNCKFVLIDSLNKRVNFLSELINKLELKNCVCIHSRIEDYAIHNKNSFNKCVARAVAPLPILLEYTIPLLKVNGTLLAYKGSNYEDEINTSKNALKILNSKINSINSLYLPNGDSRNIIEITKTNNTPPIYPRSGNKPRTNTL